jgi:hypothetical protein
VERQYRLYEVSDQAVWEPRPPDTLSPAGSGAWRAVWCRSPLKIICVSSGVMSCARWSGVYPVPRSCQGEDGIKVVFLAVVVLWGHIHQELVRHLCVSVSRKTCAVAHAISGRRMQIFGESHTTHRQNKKPIHRRTGVGSHSIG